MAREEERREERKSEARTGMTERRETGKVDQNSMARNSLTTLAHDSSIGAEVVHEREKESRVEREREKVREGEKTEHLTAAGVICMFFAHSSSRDDPFGRPECLPLSV